MTARRLDVLVNERLVGQLRDNNDIWEFEYSPEWAASSESFDLAPALPRSTVLHRDGASDRPAQWYFDNLLPEEALRTLIAEDAKLPAEDAFGLLAYYGAESAGSLVLREPGQPAPAEKGLRPLPLKELHQRILAMPGVSLTRDAPKKMSLAGAQHKLLVVLQGTELFEPLPGTPSTHILKPNHPDGDYAASVMNEYYTMRLAKAVGLDVPPVHRLYTPEPVYIVERFDRIRVGDCPEVERHHVIDACQLLNKARTFKYTAASIDTLREAVEHCRSRALARLSLYRWLVFNVLVGNGDNHIKNISFRIGASGIDLAPAYDLLSTATYETKAMANEKARWPHSLLALPLADATTFERITRNHLLEAGASLGLAMSTAERELDRLVKETTTEADKLLHEIESTLPASAEGCPDPDTARLHVAGELRLLRALRHLVLAEMTARLA